MLEETAMQKQQLVFQKPQIQVNVTIVRKWPVVSGQKNQVFTGH
jgi:hypothetical protein